MAQKQRLEIINRIIFLYTEDYYLSKHLDEDTIRILQEPAKLLQDPGTTDPKRSLRNAVKDYDLRRDICLPNLFSKTSLDKGTQRKTTENELPSLTQCTA